MDPDIFYDKYIAEDFETKYVPKSFERICKQYLIRKNRKGLMDEIFEKIGKYYYDEPVEKRNGEFDIVTLDDKGYIFYEGNYSAPRLGYINFWSKQRKYNFCFIIALLRKVDNFSM